MSALCQKRTAAIKADHSSARTSNEGGDTQSEGFDCLGVDRYLKPERPVFVVVDQTTRIVTS